MPVRVYLHSRIFGNPDEEVVVPEGVFIDLDPANNQTLRVMDGDSFTVAMFQDWRYALFEDADDEGDEGHEAQVISLENRAQTERVS